MRATLSRGQKLPKAVFSAVLDRLEQAFGEQHDPAACTPDGAHQADEAHPTGSAQTSITLAIGTSEHRDEYCAPNKTALCSNSDLSTLAVGSECDAHKISINMY